MGFFDKFPYTNFHEINLDWIISKIRSIDVAVQETTESAAAAKQSEDNAAASEQQAGDYASAAHASEVTASQAAATAAGAATSASASAQTVLAQVGAVNDRLDTLIVDGQQTAGNTELIDIRTGYTGHSYSTAGDAVRGQAQNLHDENLSTVAADGGTLTVGQRVNFQNGVQVAASGLSVVQAPAYAGERFLYLMEQSIGGTIGLAFYNSLGNHLGGVGSDPGSGRKIVTAPATTAYVKATVWDDNTYPATAGARDFCVIGSAVDLMAKVNSAAGQPQDLQPGKWELVPIVWEANKFYDGISNTIGDFTGINCSGYIDISGYKAIKFCGVSYALASACAILDADYNQLLRFPQSSYAAFHDELVILPSNAKYCIMNDVSGQGGQYVNVPRLEVSSTYVSPQYSGKMWAAVGDSLTEQAPNGKALMNYCDYVQNATGINVYNMGVSGTGYKNYPGLTFPERLLNLPVNTDVVTIFGSGNDMGKGYPLGSVTDTGTDTLCGCINTAIDNILATVPTAKIGLITPTPWKDYPTTASGNEMELYSQAIVQICRRRGIACLDLYHASGLYPQLTAFRGMAFDDIGVHPNALGHRFIASHVKAFIDTLIISD